MKNELTKAQAKDEVKTKRKKYGKEGTAMKKAMMKIKASLTNNVGIKVIAVVIAALIWAYDCNEVILKRQ